MYHAIAAKMVATDLGVGDESEGSEGSAGALAKVVGGNKSAAVGVAVAAVAVVVVITRTLALPVKLALSAWRHRGTIVGRLVQVGHASRATATACDGAASTEKGSSRDL